MGDDEKENKEKDKPEDHVGNLVQAQAEEKALKELEQGDQIVDSNEQSNKKETKKGGWFHSKYGEEKKAKEGTSKKQVDSPAAAPTCAAQEPDIELGKMENTDPVAEPTIEIPAPVFQIPVSAAQM